MNLFNVIGTVGRPVTSNIREPWFESSLKQLMELLFLLTLEKRLKLAIGYLQLK